jgi:hypothetical protein
MSVPFIGIGDNDSQPGNFGNENGPIDPIPNARRPPLLSESRITPS